ncbi:restriction endonuclease [Streptomyces sp. NPDC090112]|uniref:restriction endonuclease n=1 Tax=Streptomyces sp. NPDC090112 TaxID=3365949 RepID=UPI003812C896
MHINWATSVTLPDYADPELQKQLHHRIAEATDDDLLAAYLHWTEGRVAAEWSCTANALKEDVERELHHLDALRTPIGTVFSLKYFKARGALRGALREAQAAAGEAVGQARTICAQLSKPPIEDLTRRYRTAEEPSPAPVEPLGHVMGSLSRIERELRRALREHRNAMHDLAQREQALESFMASDDSIALENIHTMSPAMFEQTVAALARRDGHTILRSGGGARDLGADVITQAPDGNRVVLQCKHRVGGRGKVGSPEVQTLNGTARPEHKADIVVAVTNGTFTKPASDFAKNHDISLMDASKLQRWATWGEPLLSIVGTGRTGQEANTGWWSQH